MEKDQSTADAGGRDKGNSSRPEEQRYLNKISNKKPGQQQQRKGRRPGSGKNDIRWKVASCPSGLSSFRSPLFAAGPLQQIYFSPTLILMLCFLTTEGDWLAGWLTAFEGNSSPFAAATVVAVVVAAGCRD